MKIFLGVSAVLLVLGICFQCGVIVGRSMDPTLKPGQLFVMERAVSHWRPVRVGDVIAFTHSGTANVKRVAAVGGSTIKLTVVQTRGYRRVCRRLGGKVRPDWVPIVARRVERRKVPPGYLFVMGDNAEQSEDSRHFGFVPVAHVQGRVLFCRPGRRDFALHLPPVSCNSPLLGQSVRKLVPAAGGKRERTTGSPHVRISASG